MNRLTNILVLAVLLGSSFLLLYGGIDNTHLWGDDFSAYIMQARSLVHGNISAYLVANRFTIEQSSDLIGPVAYPWGFPLLLAPIYAFFGFSIVAFKSLNLICYLSFLLLLWYSWPAGYSDLSRFVFVALFGWNPYFQEFMNQVLSDIPFLLFSTLSIILMRRVAVERQWLISKTGDHLLLGLVMAAAFFIRTNGFLLVVTLALTQFTSALKTTTSRETTSSGIPRLFKFGLHTLRSNLLVLTLPYVSFALSVMTSRILLPSGEYSYFWSLKGLSMSVVQQNIHHYIDALPAFLTGVPHQELIYGATIPLAVHGIVQRRRSDYPMIFYVGLTLILYILWPNTQHLRFLFPILPFYAYFVLVGLERGYPKPFDRWAGLWNVVRLSPALLVLLYFGRVSAMNANLNLTGHRYKVSGPYLPTAQEVFSFITKVTESNSVVLFFKPRAMRLFTGRPSLMISEAVRLSSGDYLCEYLGEDAYNQLSFDTIARLVKEGRLGLMYQNPDFRLYRIHKSTNNRALPDSQPAAVHARIPPL